MKRILFLTCIGTLALGLTAFGAPKQGGKGGKSAQRPAAAHVAAPKGGGGHAARQAPKMSHASAPKVSRGHSVTRTRSASVASRGGKTHSRSNVTAQRGGGKVRHNAGVATNNAAMRNAKTHGRNASNVAVQNERNLNRGNAKALRNSQREAARAANANAQVGANGKVRGNGKFGAQGNTAVAGATAAANGRNTIVRGGRTITNPATTQIVDNWAGVSGPTYTAFRDYRQEWHDRSWWDSNYTRIILVGGGWWYWNLGYWYPAWGYDPYYNYYPYDGPIYGYGDLTPDRIIINVQVRLRNDGYYVGAIDGILGSQTRRALAAFQADHGLAVTSAVDQPTLATLGLT